MYERQKTKDVAVMKEKKETREERIKRLLKEFEKGYMMGFQ